MAACAQLEGIALLMTTDEAIAACATHGWEHNLGPGDGRYTIAPGLPVLMLSAKIEGGRIVTLEATYDPHDPARAAAPLAQLPIARDGALLGSGWRATWAADRAQAIVAWTDGRSVVAAHLGAIADEREVRAFLVSYGSGLEPPVRA